jgi:hypothetical protein
MKLGILEYLVVLALLIAAAVIAMVVRAEDDPKTPWSKAFWGSHVKVFIYALIAAWLALWVFGYDVTQPKDFLSILGIAYLGFSFVKAMVSRAVQDNAPAAPKV